MSAEQEPVIVDYVRTPIGRFRGALKDVRADDLAAIVLAAIVARSGVPADEVDEVVLGCANQAGEDNRNVARMALLLAGLPEHVPGVTVNRLCASGLEAVWLAARAIKAGEGDLFLVGGVESMTRAPLVMGKPSTAFPTGPQTLYDTSLGWRFPNEQMKQRFPLEAMGETAENVQAQTGITRDAQDRFALTSHQRAVAAAAFHAEELIPVEVPGERRGSTVRFDRDEGPRADTTLEKLAGLPTVFRTGGTVTAGNSSPLNDGAAALLVCSAARAQRMGWKPLARIVTGAAAGVDPRVMGLGPIPATKKALVRAGWSTRDLDRVELNEAFAVQALAVMQSLELPAGRVNVNGGAIAIGHPLGCSGARLAGTLARELQRSGGRRGLASLCVGVGQGLSLLLERA